MTTEQSAVLLLAEIKRRTVELQQEQATAVELLAKIHRAVGALERQLLVLDERLMQLEERTSVIDTRLSRMERENRLGA